MKLRPYQDTIIEQVREHLRAGRQSILIQLPTGGGKTALTASMLGNAASRGNRCAFGVHRRELVKQAMNTFDFVGIRYGVVSAGWHPNRRPRVQIASIPSWCRRIKQVGQFDIIVWDECQHIAAKSWTDLHEAYPNAVHIGLTATPERLDGRGLGDYFKVMVQGPTTRELIEQGYLAPYQLLTVPSVRTEGLHKRMGDFAIGELIERMNASTVTGDAVAHYQKHAAGRRAVAFEASVERSERLAEAFKAAGIAAAHVDGNTPTDERDRAVADFAAGRTKVLCNVELFGEGFDLPEMEAVILCRPTQSLSLYLQQVGRGLRTAPGKRDCIILDHAGNYQRHGAPDAERVWSLEGRVPESRGESESVANGRVCTFCYATSKRGAPKCKTCGKAFEVKARKIEELDGELIRVDSTEIARQREVAAEAEAYLNERVLNYDELVQKATREGKKNPHGYACWVLEGRQKRRAG